MASHKPKATADLFTPWGSWAIGDWPENIYPNKADAGRHLCRAHRDSLEKAGALVRVGRELIVLGAAYFNWLKQRGLTEIEMPCNKPALIAKRKKK
jgi:hypothetical protein